MTTLFTEQNAPDIPHEIDTLNTASQLFITEINHSEPKLIIIAS